MTDPRPELVAVPPWPPERDPWDDRVPVATKSPPRPGWLPVDLGPYLDGTHAPPLPSIGRRDDGAGLLYPGKVHSLAGESEAGKSWLALLVAHQLLEAGSQVIYLDLEDSPGPVVGRLLSLGTPERCIAEGLHYVQPATALREVDQQALAPLVSASRLVVLDGVTEALALHGRSSVSDTDVAAFYDLLPRWLSRLGPAVLLLDHVVKDREQRGGWATGSQHKLAAVDGAAFILEPVHPFGVGMRGSSRLYVAKDRLGQVRPQAAPSAGGAYWLGDLVLDSDAGVVDCRLVAPASTQPAAPFRPTVLMQRVSDVLLAAPQSLTTRDVLDRVPGRGEHVRQALALLVDEGFATVAEGARGSRLHTFLKPYSEAAS